MLTSTSAIHSTGACSWKRRVRPLSRPFFPALIIYLLSCLGAFSGWPASAQTWNEVDDAPSFPDRAAQVTRGLGALDSIVGSTGSGDPRDAYCIKIVDTGDFLATTDPASHPEATADFDTRLFLFRSDLAPVLANDDTPPSLSPFLSTLTSTATDGSGFTLTRPGEYTLVVSGFSDDPKDFTSNDLFVLTPADVVAAPDPSAGPFHFWEGGAVATGSYTVALSGAAPCLGNIDAVFANYLEADRRCFGGDSSGFEACSDVSPEVHPTLSVALGFVDDDRHLDAVFAISGTTPTTGGVNRLCLGNGGGGFRTCTDVGSDTFSSTGVALGLVDTDPYLDAVFTNGGQKNRVCLGDGSGGFGPCLDVDSSTDSTTEVALGYLNVDTHLDAVFSNSGQGERNTLCLGQGGGAFTCSYIQTDEDETVDLALGFMDADGYLDVVFANRSTPSRICLGNGSGGFAPCQTVSPDIDDSRGVALGDLDGDGDLDAVFANFAQRNRVCLGDGNGGFTACEDASPESGDFIHVALGLVDDDQVLDAVFTRVGATNRVCFGDGAGLFASCTDVGATQDDSFRVSLGELGFGEIFVDGFESGDWTRWSFVLP